jgi:hypothetical protein
MFDFDEELTDYFNKTGTVRPDDYYNPLSIKQDKTILADMFKVIAFLDRTKPKTLYYGISKIIKRGEIIHISETEFQPEYIVINVEDFKENKDEILKNRFLIPIEQFDYFRNYLEIHKF